MQTLNAETVEEACGACPAQVRDCDGLYCDAITASGA